MRGPAPDGLADNLEGVNDAYRHILPSENHEMA